MSAEQYARRYWQAAATPPLAAEHIESAVTWRSDQQIQKIRELPAPIDVAATLNLEPDSPVIERSRLLLDASGAPTHMLTSY